MQQSGRTGSGNQLFGFFHLNTADRLLNEFWNERLWRRHAPPKNNWTNLFQIKKTEQHKNIVLAIIINGKNFIALIKKYAKAKLCPWRGGAIVVTRLLHMPKTMS